MLFLQGKPDCLKNLTFMRTGVLDSLEGEEFQAAVVDHGGRVVYAVSSISLKCLSLVVFNKLETFQRKSIMWLLVMIPVP